VFEERVFGGWRAEEWAKEGRAFTRSGSDGKLENDFTTSRIQVLVNGKWKENREA
jgi:hypothetical protein